MRNDAISSVRTWAEMVKLSHSVFALPFALLGAFLAGRNIVGRGMPHWGQLGLVVVCMVSARSVAMTFNRIVDANIDARNPRTASRPLPAGRLSLTAGWTMLGISAVFFMLGCLGFEIFYGNHWPILLAIPVLVWLCGYSLTKRFTQWSHFYLGSAIALSPGAAWLAVHPSSIGLSTGLLILAVACWIAGFDIIYACQDIDSDQREQLHSLPSRLGPSGALLIARIAHVVVVFALVGVGLTAHLGTLYILGLVCAALLLAIENAMVHPGDYSRINLAFFTMNGVVSIVFATAAIADILLASAALP